MSEDTLHQSGSHPAREGVSRALRNGPARATLQSGRVGAESKHAPDEDGLHMEIRPGYKQTEIGVIPEDWQYEALEGKVAIEHGYGFQSQYFKKIGHYMLATPGNFHEDGGFRDIGEKQKYYDGPLPEGYLLRTGDLIVAMTEQAEGLLSRSPSIIGSEFTPCSGYKNVPG